MIRDDRAVLDRPRTTEKPFEGEESCDNSEVLFSQVQYHAVTCWRTMNGNDEFYSNVTPGRGGSCPTAKSLRNHAVIVTAGKHQPEGDASGVITSVIIDKLE